MAARSAGGHLSAMPTPPKGNRTAVAHRAALVIFMDPLKIQHSQQRKFQRHLAHLYQPAHAIKRSELCRQDLCKV